jgi:hypothetical protein
MEGITFVKDGFVINAARRKVLYMNIDVAARKAGLHRESLSRLYRQSGVAEFDRSGLKIGRKLFFTDKHLKKLGYPKN